MTMIREQIDTTLTLDEAFAFVADFANAERWDPGVENSERIGSWEGDGRPPGVGVRYRPDCGSGSPNGRTASTCSARASSSGGSA